MNRDEILKEVARLETWRHRIRLSEDIVTPGLDDTEAELERLRFPRDFSGLRVLDICCSDGFYSFEAERRGARYVLAIDDFSSLMNPKANGFEIASRILGSGVEFLEMSVYDLDPHDVGTFDLVIFLNVLYHLKHPFLALERIRDVVHPGGLLFLKSYYTQDFRFQFRGRSWGFDWSKKPKLTFYEESELRGDSTNWWGPNRACLEALLRASGFEELTLLDRASDRIYYRCNRSGES